MDDNQERIFRIFNLKNLRDKGGHVLMFDVLLYMDFAFGTFLILQIYFFLFLALTQISYCTKCLTVSSVLQTTLLVAARRQLSKWLSLLIFSFFFSQ